MIGHRSALQAVRTALTELLGMPQTASVPLAFLPAGEEQEPIQSGVLSPEAGRFRYLAVKRAVALARTS